MDKTKIQNQIELFKHRINARKDYKPRMFDLMKKFKDNTINEKELLEMSSYILKYTELDFGKDNPKIVINESAKTKEDEDASAAYSMSSGNIEFSRWYIDEVLSGKRTFQEFSNTIIHEQSHFFARQAVSKLDEYKQKGVLTPEIIQKIEEWKESFGNYKVKQTEAEDKFELLNSVKEQQRFENSEEYKNYVKEIRTLNNKLKAMYPEDEMFEPISLSQEGLTYNELLYDINLILQYAQTKDDKDNLYNTIIDVDKIREIATKVTSNYILEEKTEESQTDKEDVSFAVYTLDQNEMFARTNAIAKQEKMYQDMLFEKDIPSELKDWIMDVQFYDLAGEEVKEVNRRKDKSKIYKEFLDTIQEVVDNTERIGDDGMANNNYEQDLASLQYYLSKNLPPQQNAKRLINNMTHNKGAYNNAIISSLASGAGDSTRLAGEKQEAQDKFYEFLQNSRFGSLHNRQIEEIVNVYGIEKSCELVEYFDNAGKTLHAGEFLGCMLGQKRDIEEYKKVFGDDKELIDESIKFNDEIDNNVVPVYNKFMDRAKGDLGMYSEAESFTADDFVQIKAIKDSFSRISEVNPHNVQIQNDADTISKDAYVVGNKFWTFLNEDDQNNCINQYKDLEKNSDALYDAIQNDLYEYRARELYDAESYNYGYAYAQAQKNARLEKHKVNQNNKTTETQAGASF